MEINIINNMCTSFPWPLQWGKHSMVNGKTKAVLNSQ